MNHVLENVSEKAILVIGRGNLARHFCHYFNLLNLKYEQWHRGQSFEDLKAKSAHCDRTLLLISDSAIAGFIREHDATLPSARMHCSGSLFLENVFGAHPLMTFSQEQMSLHEYRDIVFAVDHESFVISDFLHGIANSSFYIEPKNKALYHALCVTAGNFSYLLWQMVAKEFDLHGWPSAALKPYSAAIFKNVSATLANPNLNLLSGPLQRGDQETVLKNLNALENSPLKEIYQSFQTAFQRKKS